MVTGWKHKNMGRSGSDMGINRLATSMHGEMEFIRNLRKDDKGLCA